MCLIKKIIPVFLVLVLHFGVFEARADSDAEKLRVARQVHDAWNKLDVPRIVSLFAEKAKFYPMYSGKPLGREELQARWTKLLEGCTRLELQVRNMGIIKGAVFVERVDDFDYKGKHGRVPVMAVIEIKNGKIVEWREYYDRNQLLTEMGIVTEKPTN